MFAESNQAIAGAPARHGEHAGYAEQAHRACREGAHGGIQEGPEQHRRERSDEQGRGELGLGEGNPDGGKSRSAEYAVRQFLSLDGEAAPPAVVLFYEKTDNGFIFKKSAVLDGRLAESCK